MNVITDKRLQVLFKATALLIACSAVAAIAVVIVPSLREGALRALATRKGYREGERIDLRLDWVQSPTARTIVVFGRSSCGACQRAKAAFRRMIDETRGRARVLYVTIVPLTTDETEYAHHLGISADNVVRADPSALRLRGVPTVVVTDNAGVILFASIRAPTNKADEDELVAAVQDVLEKP